MRKLHVVLKEDTLQLVGQPRNVGDLNLATELRSLSVPGWLGSGGGRQFVTEFLQGPLGVTTLGESCVHVVQLSRAVLSCSDDGLSSIVQCSNHSQFMLNRVIGEE